MTLARSGLSPGEFLLFFGLTCFILGAIALCSVIDPVLRLGKGRRVTRPNSILLDDVIKNDFLLLLSSSMAFSAWLLKK